MSPPGSLIFVEVDVGAPEAVSLISALDAELGRRYPGVEVRGIEPAEFRSSGGVFLIGRLAGVAVACGALRPVSENGGELKRMFVRADQRGRGFGGMMLAALERIATARGYRAIRLETGAAQPEAIGLYERAGYRAIPCPGERIADERARCFEKSLARLSS
jgi:putative acetyltransferase